MAGRIRDRKSTIEALPAERQRCDVVISGCSRAAAAGTGTSIVSGFGRIDSGSAGRVNVAPIDA